MKILVRTFVATLWAAASVATWADTTAPKPPRATVSAAEAVLALRDFDSTYEMSSGRTMVVTSYGETLRVSYGRRTPVTLRHDGQGSFVSKDGKMGLQFELDGSGDAKLVRLLLPAGWL